MVSSVIERLDPAELTPEQSEVIDQAWAKLSALWAAEEASRQVRAAAWSSQSRENEETPENLAVVGGSNMTLMVDLQGRLSNPRDAFVAVSGLLPVVLQRPIPTNRAELVVQHQRRLAGDVVSELVRRRHRGETIDSLAGAFGVHRTTVMAHLTRSAERSRSGVDRVAILPRISGQADGPR